MLKRRTAVLLAVAVVSGGISVAATPAARALAPLSSFGAYGQGAGQMSTAGGIAIGPDGFAYVADTGNNRIDVFSGVGTFVRTLGKVAVPSGTGGDCEKNTDSNCQGDNGSGAAGVLSGPKDLAIDSAGNVFVADTGNNRIDVFTSAGTFVRAFGKGVNPAGGDLCTEATKCQRGSSGSVTGAISSPTGIGIDAAGLLYVAAANLRIDVFSPAGAFIRSIGKEVTSSSSSNGNDCKKNTDPNCQGDKEAEAAGAMNTPYDVAIDAGGQVAVTDYRNLRIDVFTSTGTFIRAFGKGVNPAGGDVCTTASGCQKGTESGVAGGLASPSAIAVGGSESLYIADIKNHRIDEFGFDGGFVRAFGEGVISGAPTFQVCSTATGCKTGLSSTNAGSVSGPRGTAVDCMGAVYAVESVSGSKDQGGNDSSRAERVERFGEPGTMSPPCLESPSATPPPGSVPASSSSVSTPPPAGRHGTAKPIIEIELNKGSGTATLIVIVSAPGSLLLRGKGIRKVKRIAKHPGLVELFIEATGKVRQKLEETGKVRVKLVLTFAPDEGAPVTLAKALALEQATRF